MAQKITIQDKKEMDKFTKYLAFKVVQIIVQSRLGEKVSTQCKPNPTHSTDWFNLAVPDDQEVLLQTKKVFNGELTTSSSPLCVEISLRTSDADTMVLELWCLSMMSEQNDLGIKIMPTVYNRMGILLKSLVSVTRVTPAYKLSRVQDPDSYVICYRIYMGSPPLQTLAENYKQIRVGQICTPTGMLHLSLSYRTKMTMSPTHSSGSKDSSILVKSDHFNAYTSPRHGRNDDLEDSASLGEHPIKIGAFADPSIIKNILDPSNYIPDIQFARMKINDKKRRTKAKKEAEKEKEKKIATAAAAAEIAKNESNNGNAEEEKKRSTEEKRDPEITTRSTNDDFLMRTPFATPNAATELNNFYIEWQRAPPIFNKVPTIAEQDLAQQLKNYESDLKTYDDIVKNLCETSPNNN
ncbi:autophagy-related protein 13 homolog isoform X2 [Onthophagus taurus]|uniref:autophagy-related protein 13 homolog isoform X2 n=1 Tax=Onthophagus taurus TaxID=166361 RepID=UPI000C1FF831|nr:autophagy-related protein 13 homolog isoform X2 [Onthophagus taurus]